MTADREIRWPCFRLLKPDTQDTTSFWNKGHQCLYFHTCIVLALLIGCCADRLDGLTEDHWLLTLSQCFALGWPWGIPGDGSEAETHASAGAQEAAAPSSLSGRLGLQRLVRFVHLEIKTIKAIHQCQATSSVDSIDLFCGVPLS